MKPDHADAHYQLGMALVNQGKLAEARPMFEKYLEARARRASTRHGEGHPVAHQEVERSSTFSWRLTAARMRPAPPSASSGMWTVTCRSRRPSASAFATCSPAGAGGERAGRSAASVRLVADLEDLPARSTCGRRSAAGQIDFGENRVQEALEKIDATADIPITVASGRPPAVEQGAERRPRRSPASTRSTALDLLERVDAAAAEAGTSPELLVQVDLAGEPTKHGAPADAVRAAVRGRGACRAARVVGPDAAAAVHGGSRGRPAVLPAAPGAAGRAAGRRRAAVDAARAVDGHEPRFRGRRRRRRDHRPGGHGHLRRRRRTRDRAWTTGCRADERHATRSPPAAVPHGRSRLRPGRGRPRSWPRWPTTTTRRIREADRLRQDLVAARGAA